MPKDLLTDEEDKYDTLSAAVLCDADGENIELNNTDIETE